MDFKRRTGLFLIAASLLGFSTAGYARAVPYADPQPIDVPAGMSKAAVKEAIVRALPQRAWIGKEISANELEAKHDKAGKHNMAVRIQYNEKQVALSYKDSYNLNYQQNADGAVIHPTGITWIRNLREDIASSIANSRLSAK
jgi:hypothetical protein